jgi:hypothetical protein
MPAGLAKDKLEGIDIEKEYQLIQEKKSELSRAMRDAVEARWKIDQEFKAHGIEDVPCYYIDEHIKFDNSYERVFTTYDPKILRWAWRQAKEREPDKKLITNMSEEDLAIIDPPDLGLEGGEYKGITIERKANDEGVYFDLSLGGKLIWRETKLQTDKDLRALIDGVAEKLNTGEK